MKTNFEPGEFIQMLDSIGALLDVLIKSQNYQELTLSEYYSDSDFNLVDAREGIEQTSSTYENLKAQ